MVDSSSARVADLVRRCEGKRGASPFGATHTPSRSMSNAGAPEAANRPSSDGYRRDSSR